jgi:hypothetical protein
VAGVLAEDQAVIQSPADPEAAAHDSICPARVATISMFCLCSRERCRGCDADAVSHPRSRSPRKVRRPGDAFSAADILFISLLQFARQMLPPQAVHDDGLARAQDRSALARALRKDDA